MPSIPDPFDATADFLLQQYRNSREFRRNILRHAVMQALRGGPEALEYALAWFNTRFDRNSFTKKDDEAFRQCRHQIRVIVKGWHQLDESTQEDFIAGKIVPSTLARLLKKAEDGST